MSSLYDEPHPATPGPLAGLRVVDLTRANAGPTCVRQLAELGDDRGEIDGLAAAGVVRIDEEARR